MVVWGHSPGATFPRGSSHPPSGLPVHPPLWEKSMLVWQRHCWGVASDFLDNSLAMHTLTCIYLSLKESRVIELTKCGAEQAGHEPREEQSLRQLRPRFCWASMQRSGAPSAQAGGPRWHIWPECHSKVGFPMCASTSHTWAAPVQILCSSFCGVVFPFATDLWNSFTY